MFYDSGFHEWREHHTINLLLFSFGLDHENNKNPNNGSIERNHYVIITIMIFISSTDAHDAMNEVGKPFGICHHNQSYKNEKINKFIARLLWWCLMNQSRFLLTLCILFFGLLVWFLFFFSLRPYCSFSW